MPATGKRTRRRLSASKSVVLALAAAGLGYAAPAVATVHNVGAVTRADHTTAAKVRNRASLAAVSCQGSSWCMAVGSYISQFHGHALAQVWNGRRWQIVPKVPGRSLTSLSCLSASFCVAGGGPTGAEQWNGRSWLTMNMGHPTGGLAGISCTTRTLCMDIYPLLDGPVAQSWNGRQWHIWKQATNVCFGPPGVPCGLASVSCGSTSNCVAVGTTQYKFDSDQRTSSVVWNGKRWAFSQPPGGNPAAMNAVSCVGRFCMAVGGGYADIFQGTIATAAIWNAATKSWTDVSPKLGSICAAAAACVWANVVSCGTPSNCMTFGPAGNQSWNGQAWQPAPSVSAGKGSALLAVSCGRTFCLGVGYQTIHFVRHSLTEVWNGNSWLLQKPVDPF